MTTTPPGRCLALIGGLGVAAAIHYYRELAAAHQARGAELRLLMAHAHMPRALNYARAGDAAGLAGYLAELIGQLQAGGARIAAVPAVTPHLCIRELTAASPLPLVNLLEVVSREIRDRGLRRVALFGTRFVIESGMFGQLEGVDVVMPKPDEIDYIHDTYVHLAEYGTGSDEQRAGLTALAQTLCRRDAVESIVLAGTDFSALYNETNTDFPHLDCARVHIDSIVGRLFEPAGANQP